MRAQEHPDRARVNLLANLPVGFEPNEGQAPPSAVYVARTANLNVSLRPSGLDVALSNREHTNSTLHVDFIGANPSAPLVSSDPQASYTNYLLGNDPSAWHAHVPNFARVTYQNIYPGIDATFYGSNGQLEHDFVVAPGGDYRQIRMRIEGPTQLNLLSSGDLKLSFPDGDVILHKPQIYQRIAGEKHLLSGNFVLHPNNEFSFFVSGYDPSQPLIMDPVLIYSTYLANLSVYMSAVATDSSGDTFVTGISFSSSYPTTPGVFQPGCNSCSGSNPTPDVFITKINPTGTALIYSTFLGGSNYDQANAIAVDALGNAIVAGYTQSPDFPTMNPIPAGTFNNTGSCGFISSLSPDGSKLNYSSILGGASQTASGGVTQISAVAVDSNGNSYITGTTDSPVFSATSGALNLAPTAYPNTIAFVSKFLPSGSLGYSALLGNVNPQNGGGGSTGSFAIAVDSSADAYIGGASGTLWPTTAGAFQTSIPGATPYAAPFVAKLSPDASQLLYSTFLGDGGNVASIALNSSTDEVFVTGPYNGSGDFPTTPNAFQPTVDSTCCFSFLSELSADGSSLEYSSYFTSNISISGYLTYTSGIALDSSNNIWLVGSTSGNLFPLQYPLQSVSASENGLPATTAFVSRLNASGSALTFSSYFGGVVQGGSIVGVAVDSSNKAHIAGTTGDGLFTTPGAYLSTVGPPPPNNFYNYGYVAVIDADTAAPSLCVNAETLNFGFQPLNAPSSQSLGITNCGNASLQISSIQSSGAPFTVPAASNNCLQSLAVNASCTVAVTFTTATVGTFSGTLTITSNAPISTDTLSLSGSGAVPQISLQTSSLTFDPQFIGQTSPPQYVFIGNSGPVPLTINLPQTAISSGFAYTQYGCNQPLYQGAVCSLSLTFTPQSAGTLTGTLSITSNDPNTPVATVSLSGTGYSVYPVPTLTALSAPTIQAGTTPNSFFVYGSNFFPASVVYFNGVALGTTYQSSTVLSAAVSPSLVASPSELQITVLNPSPGGGLSSPQLLTVYQSIPLEAQSMIYEPFSQLLFASVGASDPNHPDTVAVINPALGQITQYIPVGNGPNHVAVSDDGQYVYVSLDGDHSIQRINLSSFTVDRTFSLPVDPSFGQLTVADMKVVPGASQSVVCALSRVASPAEDGLAMFNDSGLVNFILNTYPTYLTVDSFAFVGNPPVAYYVPTSIPGGSFGTFTVSSSGIQLQAAPPAPSQPIAGDLVVSDGASIYTSTGQVWNPPATLLGTYNPAEFDAFSIVPDDSLTRTFFLNPFATYNEYEAASVDAYDQNTFNFVSNVPL